MAATVDAAAPTSDQAVNRQRDDAGAIALELNRAESVGTGCRLSFVIENRTAEAFSSLQWDLVLFDPDGLITGRIAVEAAPLPARKTSVKLFDLPEPGCSGLGRILINDVMRCENRSTDDGPPDCLELTVPSSRAGIELVK